MRVCGEHRLFGVAEFVIKLPATARKPDSTFSEIVFRDIHFTKHETKRSSSKPWCSFPLAYVMIIWCELKKDKYTISDQDAEQVSPAKERGHGVQLCMFHFPGLCLISFWICLFGGFRGIVHPIFTGLYCCPRNVLAGAKLETNFMCSPVPFGP